MTRTRRHRSGLLILFLTVALVPHLALQLEGADGRVILRSEGGSAVIQVQGSEDDDWYVQGSSDLVTWSNLAGFGTLLSGSTNAPERVAGEAASTQQYFRALKTAGLYDPALFRAVSLTFTQSNWGTLLASARTAGTNVLCQLLTLDNGATNFGVGARYKGNTSYSMAGTKKSINLELDFTNSAARLMGYSTVNLNNAFGDETLMREPVYFSVMAKYTPCPKGSMAAVHINGVLWGVYSFVQQENGQLINEWFPSNDGDRWRAPNAAMGGGGGGMFTSSNSALAYLNSTNVSAYRTHYELKTTNSPTNVAWERLVNTIRVLNLTPTNELRDKVEDVLAVDNWLWFLAIENIFVDDDSYWNKGADYGFYYEVESGRIHPVEHDGNEAFTAVGSLNTTLSPVLGATGNNRPLLYRLLPINELRQRYLAHLRTVLEESFNPGVLTPLINQFHALSIDAIIADPRKGFTMATYTNDLNALRTYVTNRYNFLMAHPELTPLRPDINGVFGPTNTVFATNTAIISAAVVANGDSGVGPVWLYLRGKSYGRFATVQMLDDGAHGDGVAGDGVFGATTTNYAAGTKVRYYVEARGTNAAQAARFSPARAENETYSYRVGITTSPDTPVVINEVMASNTDTIADPQGEFDDWIELRNVTDQEVDLSGRYLSDEPNNPRKWAFPAGARIAADGYLMVWADEDTAETVGLHASFKLSSTGDELYLTDSDTNLNAILDSVAYSDQVTDRSYGRTFADADVWSIMDPTAGAANK